MAALQQVQDIQKWLSKGETPDSIIQKDLFPDLSPDAIRFIAEELGYIEKPGFLELYYLEVIVLLVLALLVTISYLFDLHLYRLAAKLAATMIAITIIRKVFSPLTLREKVRQEYITHANRQMELIAAEATLRANK